MNRKEFLLAQVEKALNEGDERKCHILIDKLVSYHKRNGASGGGMCFIWLYRN